MSRVAALLLSLALVAPALAQDGPPPVVPAPDAPKPDAAQPVVVPADAWEGVEKVPVELVHRWTVGAKLRYQTRQAVNVDTAGMGPNQRLDQTFGVAREVLEAPEGGGAKVRDTYDAIAYSMEVGAQSMTLDTRDGTLSGNPVLDAMGAMVGGAIDTRVAKDGKVEAMEGGPALMERILAAMPEDARAAMRENLAGSLSDAALTRQLQESHIVFPGKSLASGEGWRRETTIGVPNVGDLNLVQDYVLLGVVDRKGVKCAKLLVRARSSGCEARETVLNGMPGTIGVDPFEATSPVLVRLEDGLAVEIGPQTLAMTIKIVVQGQEVTLTNTSTVRCELLPDEAPKTEAPKTDAPR